MTDDSEHRTWNVFRRRDDGSLCCAVSADTPVPGFLLSGEWVFGFAYAEGDPPVVGFSADAAQTGMPFNGFHLFLAFAPPHSAMRH